MKLIFAVLDVLLTIGLIHVVIKQVFITFYICSFCAYFTLFLYTHVWEGGYLFAYRISM